MKAHEFDEARCPYPVAVEPKKDGFRVTFVDREGYTKNAETYETFRPYAAALDDVVPSGVHVDAEMCARNWNETSTLLKRKKNIDHEKNARNVTVYIFDAFSPATAGAEPYTERRKAVEWIAERLRSHPSLKFKATWMSIAHNRAELDQIFARARAEGEEGVMVKTLSGVYTPTLKKTKTWLWMKRKPFKDITVTIMKVTHGWELCPACMTKDKREARAGALSLLRFGLVSPDAIKPDPACPTCHGAASGVPRPDLLGSLVCADDDGNEWGVGMGFTDADKKALMENPPIGRKCDVKIQEEAKGASANEITGRHAVFLRFRDDV